MKLSEYIKGLEKILEEEGDMDCYYSSDDEGNDYYSLDYDGTVCYIHEDDKDDWSPSVFSFEGCKQYEEDGEVFIKICVVN